MKIYIALLTALLAPLAFAEVAVHLNPDAESPVIGKLEARSLAVSAEWPEGVTPDADWTPVYYQGVFDVYVDNNSIAKDLTAKPGSFYYLAPEKGAAKLAVATSRDKSDIISVDSWFCKMKLETIVLAYLPSENSQAPAPAAPQPAATASGKKAKQTAASTSSEPTATPATPVARPAISISELEGRLEKVGILARNRVGQSFKLVGPDGRTLAFVDLSAVSQLTQTDPLVSKKVRITGMLTQEGGIDTVILKAQTIKLAD